jgi:hypothetical protein
MSIFIVLRLEESITQCNRLNTLHIDVLCKLRIDVEEDWHIHCFSCIQSLLLEAKALNLAKVRGDLSGRNRIGGYANDVFR